MKFIGAILLLVSSALSVEAGKVIWDERGKPTITGTLGKGCTQNGFGTKEKNATKANCG
ncbi:MAG: Unknown protein [uncultured Sulfurovum sp.]|uniref:Uncharacterized protein n=1 Tax=uncultured Sulfurovum sp. TaxID=269237 RepID=A0A6S6SGX0_9BACT|nr:MAG: Unknown protein [uncultured Sulfurovum sp.]